MVSFLKTHSLKIILPLLILIPISVFMQTFNHKFVWDDEFILAHANFLNEINAKNIAHFWKKPYNELYIPVAMTAILFINQIPFTNSSDYALSPKLLHLANLIFHIFNVLLLFIILRIFTKHNWASCCASLVFAVHPLQVETVAFAWCFKDILSVFFGFIAIWQYLIYIHHSHKSKLFHYAIATFAFILAMLSKPSTIVIPLVLGIIVLNSPSNLFPKRGKNNFFPLILWLILTLPVIIITKLVQPSDVVEFITPLWMRLFIFADALNFYFTKLIYPIKLCVAYGRTPQFVITHWWFYFSWILPLLVLYLAWRFRKHFYFLMGLLVFVVGLIPISGLIPFEFQNWSTVADRYLYLPMFGISIIIAFVLKRLFSSLPKSSGKISYFFWGVFPICLSGFIIILMSYLSFIQTSYWENDVSLWSHAIKNYPNRIHKPYNNRGVAYASIGEYEKALADFDIALQINSNDEKTYYNRGEVYFQKKEYEKALADFENAIRINPIYAKAYNAIGHVYKTIGKYDNALLFINKAIERKSDYAEAYYNRGCVYQKLGTNKKAFDDYNRTLRLDKSHAKAYNNRGTLYQQRGNLTNAISDFDMALKIDPLYVKAYNNRGNAFALQGRYYLAIADYNRALEIDPQKASIYHDRAVSYFYLKRYKDAIADIEKAKDLGFEVNQEFFDKIQQYTQ